MKLDRLYIDFNFKFNFKFRHLKVQHISFSIKARTNLHTAQQEIIEKVKLFLHRLFLWYISAYLYMNKGIIIFNFCFYAKTTMKELFKSSFLRRLYKLFTRLNFLIKNSVLSCPSSFDIPSIEKSRDEKRLQVYRVPHVTSLSFSPT